MNRTKATQDKINLQRSHKQEYHGRTFDSGWAPHASCGLCMFQQCPRPTQKWCRSPRAQAPFWDDIATAALLSLVNACGDPKTFCHRTSLATKLAWPWAGEKINASSIHQVAPRPKRSERTFAVVTRVMSGPMTVKALRFEGPILQDLYRFSSTSFNAW